MPTLTYAGDFTVETEALPAASLNALIQRGWSHFMGNEQASKVVAKIRKALSEQDPPVKDPTTDQIKAYSDEHEEQITAWKNEVRKAALETLLSGTVGVHAPRGSAVDPLDREMQKLAKIEVVEILRSSGLKFPKAGETITWGDGTRTGEQMITNFVRNNEDRLRKDAQKSLAENKRRRENAAKMAPDAEAIANLGL